MLAGIDGLPDLSQRVAENGYQLGWLGLGKTQLAALERSAAVRNLPMIPRPKLVARHITNPKPRYSGMPSGAVPLGQAQTFLKRKQEQEEKLAKANQKK